MPINCDSVLAELVQDAPEQSANIDTQVEQIEEVQAELDEKNASIRECVTDKARDELQAYLEGDKLTELQGIWPEVPGVWGELYVTIGPTYGTIGYGSGNITDWQYLQVPLDSTSTTPVVRYVYTPGEDETIDGYVGDYDFGNDYITHPVGIGAAYGLEPLVDMYEQGKATLLGNKAKIEASIDVFKKYL